MAINRHGGNYSRPFSRSERLKHIKAEVEQLSESKLDQLDLLAKIRSDIVRLDEFPIVLRHGDIVQIEGKPHIIYVVDGSELKITQWTEELQEQVKRRQPPPLEPHTHEGSKGE